MAVLYFNGPNSNKSNNLAILCQCQVLTQSYLTRSTKILWNNFTDPNPTTNPIPSPQL